MSTRAPTDQEPAPELVEQPTDLRMPLLGLAAWAGALIARVGPTWLAWSSLALAVIVVVVAWRRGSQAIALTLVGVALVGVAVAGSSLLRTDAVSRSPVAHLAADQATISVTGTVISDPRVVQGRFEDQVVFRLRAAEVAGRGRTHRLGTPLLVIGDLEWREVRLGAKIRTVGRLAPAGDPDLAGILVGPRSPQPVGEPDLWWRGAAHVRTAIRDSVAHLPADQRALVPALVDGDDAGLDPGLVEDFQVTGLTHLTAVSGTNLTLVVGFALVLARWCGVRGRWLYVVGGLGIVGFVLLARTEPSVVRAAAMGTVGLLAMGLGGRGRGLRALGVAVVGLLLIDPALSVTAGFALSVLATAGIVILAPPWRDALARWLPRWLAEAIAVPAAAQLACTPVVAAISEQVSLAAVGANLLVAPAVGPATVCGLLAGLVTLIFPPAGTLLGTLAGWCVAWIIVVARWGADLPAPAVSWGADGWSLALLTALVVALVLVLPTLLRHPMTGLVCCLLLVAASAIRLPTPGFPPRGWQVAMCDVGQGDGLVLRAGEHQGVVIDVGPDPALIDRCLDRLQITQVPLLVLTHFHADHVDGLAGVVEDHRVHAVWTTSTLDPPEGVREVAELISAAGVPAQVPAYSARLQVGKVSLQVLWPRESAWRDGPGDGTAANDASVVLLAEVGSTSVLLTGDVEPEAQARIASTTAGLDIDVLKVPHHGSRHQDLDWLTSLEPEVALVSVGEDNGYGHPADSTLVPLIDQGAVVCRTDLDGTVVLTAEGPSEECETTGG